MNTNEQIDPEEPPKANSELEKTVRLPSRFDGSSRIGPYKLLQKLGEGGMGEVWMAEQEQPVRRRVALKLIKAGMDDRQVIARFEAERQALAMMDHPNIAKVLDIGTTEFGQPYFVMELVQGIPFTSYCDRNKLSIKERLELFIPVCNAVQHAHQKGIMHRDLKPSNVLVCLFDGKPAAKVIDFGLAKALQHQVKLTDKTMFTEFGQVVGTLQYMSPEQAEMNQIDIDTRTDIYSLGVMLYELLTGSTPIDTDTLKQNAILKVLETIREKDPPRPSHRLSTITLDAASGISAQRRIEVHKLKTILRGELDWIVMKALEKDRTRRYETANGFAEDLIRYLSGDIVLARPPSAIYRMRKYVSRNKGLIASMTSIAVFLCGGILGTTWFALQANDARKNSEEKTAEVSAERDRANEEAKNARVQEILAENARREADSQRQQALIERKLAEEALAQNEAILARSNYLLAVARWNEHRASEAVSLLNLIPEKYRNIEWNLAQRNFEGSDITLFGHTESISSVCFSPDGTRVVSGSLDKTIKVWDSVSGQELRTLRGHSDGVTCVDLSPDGMRIVSGGQDKSVKLWDVNSGQEILRLVGHNDYVQSVNFSHDGTKIVSSSSDQTLKLWDASSGQELCTFDGHAGLVATAEFSPDGTRIASGGNDFSMKLWDVASGQELLSMDADVNLVRSISFSPDGTRVVSACQDGSLQLWNATNGRKLLDITAHPQVVDCVQFSPDGTKIASASWDTTTKLFDATNGRELRTLSGHLGWVTCVSFSPDGTRLVTGSDDKSLKIWDVRSGEELHSLSEYTGHINSVSFHADSNQIATGSRDGTFKLWDADSGQVLRTHTGNSDWIESTSFSTDGTRIVTGSFDGTLKIWQASSGEELQTLVGHSDNVNSVSFSPDSKRIVSASADHTLKLWDATSGQELQTFRGHTGDVTCVSFNPEGTLLVSGSRDKTAKLWNATDGQELRSLNGHSSRLNCVRFSPDGRQIVTGSEDSTLKLWDADLAREIRTFRGHANGVTCAIFSPDGSRIISGSRDESIRIWDVASGQELRALPAHNEGVSSVSINADGTRIASVGEESALMLWNPAMSQQVHLLKGHSDIVNCASLSPNGTLIASASSDKTIKLWDAINHRELRTLVGHAVGIFGVKFSPDGNQLVSEDYTGVRIVWDVASGNRIDGTPKDNDNDFPSGSTNGRWLVMGIGNNVGLVDLNYEYSPQEKSWRQRNAILKPEWHLQQAKEGENASNSFASLFHRAWLFKARPERSSSWHYLHAAHKRWIASIDGSTKHPLPPIVLEMLELPCGDTVTEEDRDDLRRLNLKIWEQVKIPNSPKPDEILIDLFRAQLSQTPRAHYFNTLGTAEYRLGNYQAAIDACSQSLETLPKELQTTGPHPIDLAVIAMAYDKLGNKEEASNFKTRFEESIRSEEYRFDKDCLLFATEIEELAK